MVQKALRTKRRLPFAFSCLAFVASFVGARARAEQVDGTWTEPIGIHAFPFSDGNDTAFGVEMVDAYECQGTSAAPGPEVVYAFTVDRPGRITAWVEGDVEGAVDVEAHIGRGPPPGDGTATCLARGDHVADAFVEAGAGWISIDTTVAGGIALSGPYVVRIDFVPLGGVRERPIARGVSWRIELYEELGGRRQAVNVLDVDLREPGVTVAPRRAEGCERTSAIADREGAVAAVNGGFFSPSCEPVGLLRIEGRQHAENPVDRPPRAVLGLGEGHVAVVGHAAPGAPFPFSSSAMGGLPMLVHQGAARVTWREERASPSFTAHRHPRTAACVTGDDHLLFVTFDGRTPAGRGVSLYDLADYLVDAGCDRGLNFDGGGSTVMWVAPPLGPGVVSYPADNGRDDHLGERPVSNSWLVWAPPLPGQ